MNESISKPLNESIKQSLDPSENKLSKSLPADRASLNEVYEQQLSVIQSDQKKRLTKRYKIITGVSVCCLVVGLIMFLLLPPLLHSAIVSQAIDQAILSPDNEKFWAHFPGDSGTIITRNYSFFNFTNSEEFFLLGQKPKFRQVEGYIITQFEDYFDIKYNQDMTKVSMKDWLHFRLHQDSKSLEQKLQIVNLPALGFWYTLKNSRDSIIFIEAFSLLFTSIQQSIIDTVIGQGISSQYLPDFPTAYMQLFQPAGISRQNSLFLWSDVAYGFKDKNNIKYWVEAAQSSFSEVITFSDSALDLKDYFTLSDFQLYYILNSINQYSQSLQSLILDNHYCSNITKCTGHELAVRQLAQSYVTYKTPPVSSIIPTDTICTDNITCNGFYPEISAYLKNVYLVEHPDGDPFLTFDVQTVRKWVDYNPTGKPGEYNKAESCLMHIGNLDALFANGTYHDQTKKDHIDTTQYLLNIKSRFQLPTQAHTRVFWQWIKYLISNLIRQNTTRNQKLGISNSFSSGIYDSFNYIQDHLQHTLLKQMIKNWLSDKNCDSLIQTSFQTSDAKVVQNICNNYSHNIQSNQFINDSISICRNKYRSNWMKWKKIGATNLHLESFCDRTINNSFGQLYHNMRKQLNDFYNCDQTPNYYCSDYEIALKQWANSSVTSNLPPSVAQKLPKVKTFSEWDKNAYPIQLQYFSNKANKPVPFINMSRAYQLFNFDNIFSATSNLKTFKDTHTEQSWRDYMRYIVVFVGFKGFTNQRTAREYIFGYNDDYLLWRKNNYPPFGGDPSTPAYTAFNDLNITQDQVTMHLQWHTGKDNSTMTAQYYKINNCTYLTTNYSHFNGNESYWALQDPWAERDYFYGTNGKSFAPDQRTSKYVSIYVPNIQRYGRGSLEQSYPYERYGYDLDIAYLGRYIYESGDQNPDNKKYYQKYFGIFNETSILGAPLFMTKHHFMNSSNWSSLIQVFNQNQSIEYIQSSHWDDSYVIVQPYSGVSFQSTLYLQANYFYETDQLFRHNQTILLPVFSVYRSGNLTEEKANELFKPLTTALSIRTIIFYVGIVLCVISIAGVVFGVIKLKKINNKRQESKESIKISMQPQVRKGKSIKGVLDEQRINKPLIKQEIEDDQEEK